MGRTLILFATTIILSNFTLPSTGASEVFGYRDGLYEGLPDCSSRDLPEKMHAVKLPEVDPEKHAGMKPPVTDDIFNEIWLINGKPAPKMTYLEETRLYYSVFPNQEFVYLPKKAKILRTNHNESPHDWEFPDGMMFFHRINIRKFEATKDIFFELRVIKRIAGRWVFGVYVPSTSGPCQGNLELRKVPVNSNMHIRVYRDQKVIEYQARPLDPRSCIDCHGGGDSEMHGIAMSNVGPCNYWFVETLQKSMNRPLFGKKN